jgi:hypothetical protein
MAKTRSKRIIAAQRKSAPQVLLQKGNRSNGKLQRWAQAFFAYLEKETKVTNPALFELLHYLGADGRKEVALLIYDFLRPDLWKNFSKDRQRTGQKVKKVFSKARRDLRRAAASYQQYLRVLSTYRQYLNLLSELEFEVVPVEDSLPLLPNELEREANRVTEKMDKCKVFSKKRIGIKKNHGILFRLQAFIEEFGRIYADRLPASVIRTLSPESLADLIEAGESATGSSDSETSAESIDRALRRFRDHEDNQRICQILTASAREVCRKLYATQTSQS